MRVAPACRICVFLSVGSPGVTVCDRSGTCEVSSIKQGSKPLILRDVLTRVLIFAGANVRANMKVTRQADYSLRVLLYLALHPGRICSVGEIASSYGVSAHHLSKVAQLLGRLGYIELIRGQAGGLRLACDPDTVTIGELVRKTEPSFDLLECFDHETNTCPIDGVCSLKGLFKAAQKEFLKTLDKCTLSRVAAGRKTTLVNILKTAGVASG